MTLEKIGQLAIGLYEAKDRYYQAVEAKKKGDAKLNIEYEEARLAALNMETALSIAIAEYKKVNGDRNE